MTAESRPPLRKAPQSGLFMGVPVNRRGRCNFYAIKFFLYNKFLIFKNADCDLRVWGFDGQSHMKKIFSAFRW